VESTIPIFYRPHVYQEKVVDIKDGETEAHDLSQKRLAAVGQGRGEISGPSIQIVLRLKHSAKKQGAWKNSRTCWTNLHP